MARCPICITNHVRADNGICMLVLVSEVRVYSSLGVHRPIIGILPQSITQDVFGQRNGTVNTVKVFFRRGLIRVREHQHSPSFEVNLYQYPRSSNHRTYLLLLNRNDALERRITINRRMVSPLRHMILCDYRHTIRLMSLMATNEGTKQNCNRLLTSLIVVSFSDQYKDHIVRRMTMYAVIRTRQLNGTERYDNK